MGCRKSKVCPPPSRVAVETLEKPRKKPARWNSLLRGLKNIQSRNNRILPLRETSFVAPLRGYGDVDNVNHIHNVAVVRGYDDVKDVDTVDDFDYDNDQPSTSYPRDETVNAHEFLFLQRLIAAEESHYNDLYADDDFDDEIYRQNDLHWKTILKSMLASEKEGIKEDDIITNDNVAVVTGYDDVKDVDTVDDFHHDIDQPSTSYPRDETVNVHEFLCLQRLIAAEQNYYDDLYSDDDFDDEIYRQNDMHWRAILKSMLESEECKKRDEIITKDCRNHLHLANLRRQGGVTFEVTTVTGEMKSSQGGVVTEGKRPNQLKTAVVSNRTTHKPSSPKIQPPPINAMMQDFKVSRGGVAFDVIDAESPNELKAAAATRPTTRLSRPITRKSGVLKRKGGVAFVIDI